LLGQDPRGREAQRRRQSVSFLGRHLRLPTAHRTRAGLFAHPTAGFLGPLGGRPGRSSFETRARTLRVRGDISSRALLSQSTDNTSNARRSLWPLRQRGSAHST
jgi:hypothetical protein